MTGINGITYFLSTIPVWYLVDRLGRRPILLSGALMMALSLSAISYFLYLDVPSTPALVVTFVMIYNAAFGFSWGPIPWLYPPEILPLSIRSKGASLSTATNWAFNWLVGIMTPVLQDTIGWRLYIIPAFFCAVSFVTGKNNPEYANCQHRLIPMLVYFIYPETCGVRLEDMNRLFNDAGPSEMPTPQTNRGEIGSLIRNGSPIPSMDLCGGSPARYLEGDNDSNSNVDPPYVNIRNGRPRYSKKGSGDTTPSIMSRMAGIFRVDRSTNGSMDGGYRPVGQQED